MLLGGHKAFLLLMKEFYFPSIYAQKMDSNLMLPWFYFYAAFNTSSSNLADRTTCHSQCTWRWKRLFSFFFLSSEKSFRY